MKLQQHKALKLTRMIFSGKILHWGFCTESGPKWVFFIANRHFEFFWFLHKLKEDKWWKLGKRYFEWYVFWYVFLGFFGGKAPVCFSRKVFFFFFGFCLTPSYFDLIWNHVFSYFNFVELYIQVAPSRKKFESGKKILEENVLQPISYFKEKKSIQ